jgi:hypothetical protein
MMINYNQLLKSEIEGVYGDYLEKVQRIIRWYSIYDGDQKWETAGELDYVPTKKITNLTKKLINTRARFMFGREPYFDIRPVSEDAEGSTANKDAAQVKEDLLADILKANKFHSKLLKARKDCSIGGKIAIKLWAKENEGLRIIFSPAYEFFVQYNEDDIDTIEKILFVYALNNESDPTKQRIKKQSWEMVGGTCILNEGIYNGRADLIESIETDYNTRLDFIPVVIIQNGGLTGEVEGSSDVHQLWENQDSYNKLTSDDIDALKFQMFGQDVFTDASEDTLERVKISPGAIIDLQTDPTANERQAKVERLESKFSYQAKFEDTVERIKADLYDLIEVPNVNLEQMKGVVQSGKSMKAIYWGLISACEEDWTEWGPALEQMVEFIFKMVETYNLYGQAQTARFETTLNIEHYYPIQEDEDAQKEIDMQEVTTEVRSRYSYMKKWGDYEHIDKELEQIQMEKQLLEDSFTQNLIRDLGDDE